MFFDSSVFSFIVPHFLTFQPWVPGKLELKFFSNIYSKNPCRWVFRDTLIITVFLYHLNFFNFLIFRKSPSAIQRNIHANRYGLKRIISKKISSYLSINLEHHLPKTFADKIPCSSDDYNLPYRLTDGKCNHHGKNSDWGTTLSPMFRLLDHAYEDKIWQAKTFSKFGFKLPNARMISQILFPEIDRPHPQFSLWVCDCN